MMRVLALAALLGIPFSSEAYELCSMLGGSCRDECAPGELAEAGAFEDCKVKQECCVASNPVTEVRCCVGTFDSAYYGPGNCWQPVGGACVSGSANASPCNLLIPCRERQPAPPKVTPKGQGAGDRK
jgi:hypothetical protein